LKIRLETLTAKVSRILWFSHRSLDFGSLAGFTGHTNYVCNAILAKGGGDAALFDGMRLYGRRTFADRRAGENIVFAHTLKIFNNINQLIPALEMKNYLDADAYSINATLWFPAIRRLYGVSRLIRSKDALREKADALLRVLEPGDEQPGLPPGGAPR